MHQNLKQYDSDLTDADGKTHRKMMKSFRKSIYRIVNLLSSIKQDRVGNGTAKMIQYLGECKYVSRFKLELIIEFDHLEMTQLSMKAQFLTV